MENNRPKFIMLVGLPASGKSTYSEKYKNDENWVVVSTDTYIEEYAAKNNTTYNKCFKEQFQNAEIHLRSILGKAIRENKNILWDQTNLNPKSRIRKLKMFPKHYYKIATSFRVPLDEILKRNSKREEGRRISEDVIRSMNDPMTYPQPIEGFDKVFTYIGELY